MVIVGIDLSGPSNTADTSVVVFRKSGERLRLEEALGGATDKGILDCVSRYAVGSKVVVGVDAPLSYNPGGGLRLSDKSLRKVTRAAGMKVGSVMPPTMNRMAYLTLRGTVVARMLETIDGEVDIVEVHPGAAMALRDADIGDVLDYKNEISARQGLLRWLVAQGLEGVGDGVVGKRDLSAHGVDACAAALAAWKWVGGDAVWCQRADPPMHPYDFAC